MKNVRADFLKTASQTPLNEALYGKRYQHDVCCSASGRKPVGEPGTCCSCLYIMGLTKKEKNEHNKNK